MVVIGAAHIGVVEQRGRAAVIGSRSVALLRKKGGEALAIERAEFEGAGLSDAEINKITYENVARFYGLDLFADIPKEQASVGALRALATDVDTSTTSKAEYRRRFEAAESA